MAVPELGMALFSDSTPVRRDAVLAAWTSLFPKGPRVVVGGSNEGVDEYQVDDERTVFVLHMPAPAPNDEAVASVRSSWMWQQPDDVVPAHRSHAIVTAPGPEDPVGAAWDVARLCAALL